MFVECLGLYKYNIIDYIIQYLFWYKHYLQEENTSELLLQIKNSLDDNLKGFFEFSYENFLNKETERECTYRSRIPPK